ncbi:DUF1853 family protein [Photobacterium kasasachensis]|uniref:DUF1853 family protein n=1 Tax=Photobacterium kasasachensis TaxID=2910240 RepID=UPI003D0AFF74
MSNTYRRLTSKEQFRNDINAVLTSPSLTDGPPSVASESWLSAFRAEAEIPEHAEYQGNRRLGFYYQWLWQQLIEAHPHYRLVAEEVQLTWNKQTLGAVDFLVMNTVTNQLEHWEVAIKFYLAYQHSWPGPNASDNLDKKTARMLEHQLTLCDHPAFRQQLAPYFGQPAVKRLIMQGRLFYPHDKNTAGSSIAINPHALVGTWCYQSQASDRQLKQLRKTHWISPPRYQDLNTYLDTSELSIPTQAVSPDNQVWFVMPDHWPTHNRDR